MAMAEVTWLIKYLYSMLDSCLDDLLLIINLLYHYSPSEAEEKY